MASAAVTLGVTPGQLRTLLTAGKIVRLRRDVVDTAKSASLRHAAVVGDAALRAGATHEQLRRMLEEVACWADVGRARVAIPFLDGRSESAFESLSRAIMHEHELPPPELQRKVRGASGKEHRVDFYWEQWRLIGEADGKVKYRGVLDDGLTPEEAVWREKLREDDLRDAGHNFVRWTWAQMLGQTDATLARIRHRMT